MIAGLCALWTWRARGAIAICHAHSALCSRRAGLLVLRRSFAILDALLRHAALHPTCSRLLCPTRQPIRSFLIYRMY
ncbi:hypothetical protein C8Q77DRAFT_628904 [Trametes polyzona]|nr:hypothetical protein C8Q77DRAFT_628904 [Trametes polyzona]